MTTRSQNSSSISHPALVPPLELEETQHPSSSSTAVDVGKESVKCDTLVEVSGREKLKKLRSDMAGRVWIPEMWGKEEYLKSWTDCSAFDASLVQTRILSARAALVKERERVNSEGLR